MKPIFTFLILFFFLGPPIQCTPCVLPSQGIIYVDDDGDADFTKIQDAINASSDGDTIYVYSGLYQENIVVDKSILLQGENKDSTFIDGNGGSDVVQLSSHLVTITGFTIQNSFYGIWLSSSSGNTIADNTISNNQYAGIGLWNSSDNNTIMENTITHNIIGGIWSFFSSDNTITGNTISNNHVIGIWLSSSLDNIVTDNSFQSYGITIDGYKIEHWTSHIIENNTVNGRPIRYYKNMNNVIVPSDTAQVILANCHGCTIYDLNLSYVGTGLQLGFSSENTITGNTITNNHITGVDLHYSSDNTITDNIIAENSLGISLSYSSDNNTITGSTITNNHDTGIYLYYLSNKNRIIGNTISNNNNDGIAIADSELNFISHNNMTNNEASGIGIYSSHYNSISNNNFSKNEIDGIGLFSESSNNTIRDNNFLDNLKGIAINGSYNNKLFFNYCCNNHHGIFLNNADNNELSGNICENSSVGIYLEESSKNHVQQNTLSHNQQGIICSYAPDNTITKNNLISNEEQAKITTFFHKGFLIPNTWKGNYWDDWKGLCIKCIPGILYIPTKDIIGIFLPWFEVDWHPSRTPNEW